MNQNSEGRPHKAARSDITPETRVSELLDAYPELEQVLIDIAPAFARLKNPVLRRTVAKVTTLERAASVAGLSPRDLVSTLREAAGLSPLAAGGEDAGPVSRADATVAPDWFDPGHVSVLVDADAELAEGATPVSKAMQWVARGQARSILCVKSSFEPAPLVDALNAKGCETYLRGTDSGTFELYALAPHRP